MTKTEIIRLLNLPQGKENDLLVAEAAEGDVATKQNKSLGWFMLALIAFITILYYLSSIFPSLVLWGQDLKSLGDSNMVLYAIGVAAIVGGAVIIYSLRKSQDQYNAPYLFAINNSATYLIGSKGKKVIKLEDINHMKWDSKITYAFKAIIKMDIFSASINQQKRIFSLPPFLYNNSDLGEQRKAVEKLKDLFPTTST